MALAASDIIKRVVATLPTAGRGLSLGPDGRIPPSVAAQALPVFTADPSAPVVGQVWYRSDTSQLCIRHDAATTKRSAAFT